MTSSQEQTNYAINSASATTTPQQKALVSPGTVIAPAKQATNTSPGSTNVPDDPLITAAKNEGIETKGKTRDQIATELAVKLNNSNSDKK